MSLNGPTRLRNALTRVIGESPDKTLRRHLMTGSKLKRNFIRFYCCKLGTRLCDVQFLYDDEVELLAQQIVDFAEPGRYEKPQRILTPGQFALKLSRNEDTSGYIWSRELGGWTFL